MPVTPRIAPAQYVAARHPCSTSTIHAHQTRLLEVALIAAIAVPLHEAVRAIRQAIANAPELSNEALGINGGSRLGTKTSMSSEDFRTFTERAERQGRPGMAALLRLERHLGLRGNEAIHAREDTLRRWKRELQADGRITVLAGTKGGRPAERAAGS